VIPRDAAERIEAQAFARECDSEFARFELADEYEILIQEETDHVFR